MEYLSEVRMCITKRDMRLLKNNLSKIESNILDICNIKKEVLVRSLMKNLPYCLDLIQKNYIIRFFL